MSFCSSLYDKLHFPHLLKTTISGRGKTTVVLLHGLAGNRHIWDPVMRSLEHHYHCVSIDLLGHNDSPKPTNIDYTIDAHLDSIRWTLFWRGIWGKKILVGHSMGSLISVHWARRFPRGVQRLVLVAMPLYRRIEPDAKRLKRFEGMVDGVYLRFYQALRSAPQSWTIRSAQGLIKRLPGLVGQASLSAETWYPVASSLKSTIEDQITTQEIAELSETLPIDVIYGALDQLVLSSNLVRTFGERPNVRLRRVLTAHEISPIYIRAVVRAITHDPVDHAPVAKPTQDRQ